MIEVNMTSVDAHEWLMVVKDILIQEGFATTPLQKNEPGQVFGLVKKLDDKWQWHVRGFNDGRLESHIEVSNNFLEHLNSEHRREASYELKQLLDVSCEITGDFHVMDVVFRPPERLTPWKLPAAIIAGTILLSWLSKKK
jgi:hypothetical protein